MDGQPRPSSLPLSSLVAVYPGLSCKIPKWANYFILINHFSEDTGGMKQIPLNEWNEDVLGDNEE